MGDYLVNHDGPIDLQRLYEFGMRRHRAPKEVTALLVRVATDEDRVLMTANLPEISGHTWRAIRDDVLRSNPKVDYIFSTEQEAEILAAVRAALTDLGDTYESIRNALVKSGIRGEQLRSCWCPIANYLRVQLGTDAVDVGNSFIRVNGVRVRQSQSALSFIESFDDNEYPELAQSHLVRTLATPFGD